MKLHLVPPDPRWASQFEAEAARIRAALGELPATIHHIGSTSIPEIWAKPIVDILLEVEAVTALDPRSPEFVALGYEVMGEFGLPGRRYFRKDSAEGLRTHQIHAFARGSAGIERHLAFRDYMRAHPEAAQAYSNLKRKLAAAQPDDIEAYMDGKDPFIKDQEAKALAWRKKLASG